MYTMYRRFLVSGKQWRQANMEREIITKGWIAHGYNNLVTICHRKLNHRSHAELIVDKVDHINRTRCTLPIAREESLRILREMCDGRLVVKAQEIFADDDLPVTVNTYLGKHKGLVIGTVRTALLENVPKWPWLTDEVTHDVNYTDHMLATAGLPNNFQYWLRGQPNY